MENNKKTFTPEIIFPVLVLGLSCINIFNHLSNLLSLTNLLSLIGIAGAFLYLRRNAFFKTLINVWIFAQLLLIERHVLDPVLGTLHNNPIWNLSQVINLKFGFFLSSDSTKIGIYFNIVPLFYFGLLKLLEVSRLIGKELTFKKFRQDGNLDDILPLTGTVLKRVTLSKEKDWILVKLSTTFEYDSKTITHVLVKSKGDGVLKQKVKNQIAYFRIVEDISTIKEGDNDSKDFPFIDWVICELKAN